jgi:hypothetical protein
MWMSLALVNIVLSILRFHKDGWHNTFAWIQLSSWSLIFAVWSLMLAHSWCFEEDRLVMKRVLLPNLSIPYGSITSIDWTNKRNISLTLGGVPIFREIEKRTVMVHDMPGFLSEMERHVAPGVLHI